MTITPKHREVEARFRRLVTDAALPEPDGVEYEPDSVIFLWHPQKLAVCVDLEAPAADLSDVLETVATAPRARAPAHDSS